MQKNLRGLLTTLDFYCALIPAGAAAGYRLAGLLPTEARLPMSSIVLIAMSTCAQTLFGLDGRGGLTRYRLMPLRGWKVLLAKDLAFLLIVMLLTAALSPVAGVTGGLVSLLMVRKVAIVRNQSQSRWRLRAGTGFGTALLQMVAMIAVAAWADAKGLLVLVPCVALWVVSVWWGGQMIEAEL